MDISKFSITNIHRGKGDRNHIVYAFLKDEKGNLVISATLDYIMTKVRLMTKEEISCLHIH